VIVPPAGMQTGRGGVLHYFRRAGGGGGGERDRRGKGKTIARGNPDCDVRVCRHRRRRARTTLRVHTCAGSGEGGEGEGSARWRSSHPMIFWPARFPPGNRDGDRDRDRDRDRERQRERERERERERREASRGLRRVRSLVPRTHRARHAIESRAFVSIKLPDKRTHRRLRPLDTHRRACHGVSTTFRRFHGRFLRSRGEEIADFRGGTRPNRGRCRSIAIDAGDKR